MRTGRQTWSASRSFRWAALGCSPGRALAWLAGGGGGGAGFSGAVVIAQPRGEQAAAGYGVASGQGGSPLFPTYPAPVPPLSLPARLLRCCLGRSQPALPRPCTLQASAERHRTGQGRQQLPEEAESVVRLTKRLSGGLSVAAEDGSTEQQQEWHPLQQGGEQQDGASGGTPAPQQRQHESATPAAGGHEQTPACAELKRLPSATSGPVSATPKAIGAVWELVQCCVGAMPLPPDPSLPKLPRPVGLRWYDARARVALFQVASWLQVRGPPETSMWQFPMWACLPTLPPNLLQAAVVPCSLNR